jgi:hypothetical protein
MRDKCAMMLLRVVAVMDRTGGKTQLIVFIVHVQCSRICANAMLKFGDKNSKFAPLSGLDWNKIK